MSGSFEFTTQTLMQQDIADRAPASYAADRDNSWRHENVGRLLNAAVRKFEQRVLDLMAELDDAPLAASHINATRYLDIEGTRLTVMAQRAAMTKQSMSELVMQLEQLGIVARRPDPADARARIIHFTDKGLQWLSCFRRAIDQSEAEMTSMIGVEAFTKLKSTLRDYCADHDDGLSKGN